MSVTDLSPHRPSPPPAAPAAPARSHRDPGIDLVRALCVAAVMLVHGLQVAVTLGADGPVLEYATRGAAWYPALTWVLQVMPLFFVVSGFAGAIGLRRLRARGGSTADFLAARVHRLLVPALAPLAVFAAALTALAALGVPEELLREAGLRWREPLWFLAVFLGVQALLPRLLRLHDRAPWTSLFALVGAAVLVDLLRAGTGIEAIGYANLAFVWLALQQAGFLLADGQLERLPRPGRAAAAIASVAVLALMVLTGVWSPDLIAHLNPPTTALLVLGAAQTMALSLLRPHLISLARRPRIAAATGFVTARTMTFYLWNLSALLLLAGALLLLAVQGLLVLPEPSTAGWWVTRPLWLAASIALTAAAAWIAGPLERLRMPQPTRSVGHAAQAIGLGIAALGLVLATGATAVSLLGGSALLLLALRRARARAEGWDGGTPVPGDVYPVGVRSAWPCRRPEGSSCPPPCRVAPCSPPSPRPRWSSPAAPAAPPLRRSCWPRTICPPARRAR